MKIDITFSFKRVKDNMQKSYNRNQLEMTEITSDKGASIIFHLNRYCNIFSMLDLDKKELGETSEENREKLLSIYNLIDKVQIINNIPYNLLKYDRGNLNKDNYRFIGKLRSLIHRNGNILSFSPPKAIAIDEFKETFKVDECFAEEFIEGTMINVFYDKEDEHWEIATKSSIGAKVKFFDNVPLFSDLFYEVCAYNRFDINQLDKSYSYTFVMQHPANRIVMPIVYPALYLIRAYQIDKVNIREVDFSEIYNSSLGNYLSTCNIRPPIRYPLLSFDDIEKYFASMNSAYYYPGIMIYHSSGERAKVRNPTYEGVKILRGNQPKLQYQYLSLRKAGKVRDYLMYYPENKHAFSQFRELVHKYTDSLYANYVDCYIKKMRTLKEYPSEYRTNMFMLHKLYLDELREKKDYISRSKVVEFVNNMEPAHLMHVLNYNNFQQYKDTMNIDREISAKSGV